MKPLKINQKFKDLIPPLSEDELRQLTENILSEGCRDAIKVWRGIIVDGHNRYAICQAHGLPYKVAKVRFSSKEDAIIWILENQQGRRNLPEAMHIKLALQKAEAEKARQKRHEPGCGPSPTHVRKDAARATGVSEGKVHMFMKVQEYGDETLVRKMLDGEIKVSAAYKTVGSTGLAITTRKVEVLYDSGDTPDITNPVCESAVFRKIDIIGKHYRMFCDNSDLLCGGDEMARVIKRLGSQLDAVRGLV